MQAEEPEARQRALELNIGVSEVEQGPGANGGGGLSTVAIIAVAAACAVLFATLVSVFGIIVRNKRSKQYEGDSQPSMRHNTVRYLHIITGVISDSRSSILVVHAQQGESFVLSC